MDGIVVSTTMSLTQGNLKHCKEINVLPNVRYVYELVTLVTNTITVRKTLFLDICIKAGQKPQKAAVFQVSPVFFKNAFCSSSRTVVRSWLSKACLVPHCCR